MVSRVVLSKIMATWEMMVASFPAASPGPKREGRETGRWQFGSASVSCRTSRSARRAHGRGVCRAQHSVLRSGSVQPATVLGQHHGSSALKSTVLARDGRGSSHRPPPRRFLDVRFNVHRLDLDLNVPSRCPSLSITSAWASAIYSVVLLRPLLPIRPDPFHRLPKIAPPPDLTLDCGRTTAKRSTESRPGRP